MAKTLPSAEELRSFSTLDGEIDPIKHYLAPIIGGVLLVVSFQLEVGAAPLAVGWPMTLGAMLATLILGAIMFFSFWKAGGFTTKPVLHRPWGALMLSSLALFLSTGLLMVGYGVLLSLKADVELDRSGWAGLMPPLPGLALGLACCMAIGCLPALTALEVLRGKFDSLTEVRADFKRLSSETLESIPLTMPRLGTLAREEVSSIRSHLNAGRAVAVTGQGGTGKTTVLALLARQWAGPVVFLNAARYRGLSMRSQLDAEIVRGRGSFMRRLRQVAASDDVLLVIDQLDSAGPASIGTLFDLVAESRRVPGVAILLAARQEDLEERSELQALATQQFQVVTVPLLSLELARDHLTTLGLSTPHPDVAELARRPFYLSLMADLTERGVNLQAASSELALWEAFRDTLARERHPDRSDLTGHRIVNQAARWARQTMEGDSDIVPGGDHEWVVLTLRSRGVLVKGPIGDRYRFRHDKIELYFYVLDAVRNGRRISEMRSKIDERAEHEVWSWMAFMAREKPEHVALLCAEAFADDGLGFFASSKLLKAVGSMDAGGKPALQTSITSALASRKDLRHFFLIQATHPSWIRPVFTALTAAGSSPEGHLVGYLRRMADRDPASVEQCILEILSGSSLNLGITISVVERLPPVAIARVVPTLVARIRDLNARDSRDEFDFLGAEKLVKELLSENFDQAAGELMNCLLEPEAEATGHHIRLRPSEYELQRLLKEVSPLAARDPERWIAILERNLRAAVQIAADRARVPIESYGVTGTWGLWELQEDDSFIWGERVLLRELAAALEAEAQRGPSDAMRDRANRYLADFVIFRRLGLHILRVVPSGFDGIICRELARPENYRTYFLERDLLALLKDKFAAQSAENRASITATIRSNPMAATIQHVAEEVAPRRGVEPEQLAQEWAADWQIGRLTIIEAALDPETRQYLEALCAQWGPAKDPLAPRITSGTVTGLRPANDALVTTLEALGNEALVNHCREHYSRGGSEQVEETLPGGGSAPEAVAALILRNVTTRMPVIPRLVEIGPDFTAAFFRELQQHLKALQLPLPTHELLNAALDLIEASCTPTAPHRVREDAVHLLYDLSRTVSTPMLPIAERLRGVILRMTNDPHPGAEEANLSLGRSRSPIDVVLYSIRPMAFMSLLALEGRLALIAAEANGPPTALPPLDPETREVVRQAAAQLTILDAVVIGHHYARVCQLDAALAEEIKPLLFPLDSRVGSEERLMAAWGAFVEHTRFYQSLYQMLRGVFRRGLLILASRPAEEADRESGRQAAQHLAIAYLTGQEGLDSDSLVQQTLGQNNLRLNALFAWSLWRVAKDVQELRRWDLVRKLWERRLREVPSPAEHSDELSEYLRWLELIQPRPGIAETLPLLLGTLPCYLREPLFRDDLETYLASEATIDPAKVLEVYVPFANSMLATRTHFAWESTTQQILVAAANAGGTVRADAISIAEKWYQITQEPSAEAFLNEVLAA